MPTFLKIGLAAAALMALGWVATEVHIEGRTPYGHFRAAGGERALFEGWAWLKSGIGTRLDSLARGSEATAEAVAETVRGWFEAAADEAASGWAELWSDPEVPEPAPSTPAASTTAASTPGDRAPAPASPSLPGVQTDDRALARVLRLERAAAAAAPSGAERTKTRVTSRISPAEKAALAAKLAARGGD